MECSHHHHLLLLVGLLAAVAPAVVATVEAQPGQTAAASCDTATFALQVNLFCSSKMPPASTCCAAVLDFVDINGGGDPSCICGVEDEPDFLTTGLDMDDIVELYTACGGRTQLVADACDGEAPPPPPSVKLSTPPQQHDVAVQIKAIP